MKDAENYVWKLWKDKNGKICYSKDTQIQIREGK